MRWSIIRLIWLRELRDQLRDRRTVFMIAVLASGMRLLNARQIDLLVVVPPDFGSRLAADGRPVVYVVGEGDERARLVERRLQTVLARWKHRLKGARLLRHGLPPDYDDAF